MKYLNYRGEYMPRSVFDEKRQELDIHELQMGVSRGRLAVSMDILSDAMALVGQHSVYCQSARQPGKPAMDIQIILQQLDGAKQLISSVLEELRKERSQK